MRTNTFIQTTIYAYFMSDYFILFLRKFMSDYC